MSIFNRWRKYPRKKPKTEGFYQCIVNYGLGGRIKNPIIMDLYWWYAPGIGGVWVDRRRQSVFDGYKVFLANRAPIEDNRVFRDNCSERNDVIAWRKLPSVPGRFEKEKMEE